MAYTGPNKPRVRAVEVVPVNGNGGNGASLSHSFALSDPLHVAGESIIVSPAAMLVLQYADGEHSLRDIQADIARATGHILPFEQIESLMEALDERCYLESQRFREAFDAMREEFFEAPVRPATLAGLSYPEDPAELRSFLDAFFTAPDGPGRPDRKTQTGAIRAIMAPHIDLRRGGTAFAHAYRALVEESDAELFIIFGIAHYGDGNDGPYILTDKNFATPLGTVPTDREFISKLRNNASDDAFGDEYAHRDEHSIEFQAVLLSYLLPDREYRIVPILCGSLHEALRINRPPVEDDAVSSFIDALRRTIEESRKRVAIIAAVDLAHVGKRFGSKTGINAATLETVEREDRKMLESVAAIDSEAFFRSIRKDLNGRNVCGYPAIYTMLTLFERSPELRPSIGTLLRYEQSMETETESVVTFGAMAFRQDAA